jgi:diguanylate cyclase (GGDEF)-like protein
MIRIYTTNEEHTGAIKTAADTKGYEAEFLGQLDVVELVAAVPELDVLVFDLTEPPLDAATVIGALDSIEDEQLPPVLYLLTTPADIELITEVGSIINQDYSFVPIEPRQLAARLEVLTLLGARRKLTMETAITDRLTGLYNRKYFLRRLEEELYRAARYQYKAGVLLAGIDFQVPGHELTEQTGTTVIREVAGFLRDRLRKTDIVARYKWDDFAFLLPEITMEDSLLVAEDVKNKIERLKIEADGQEVAVEVYLGHVLFPVEELRTAIEVVEALEDCCFRAKTGGGEHIISYNATEARSNQ